MYLATQRQYNQLPGVQILKLWYRNCGDVPCYTKTVQLTARCTNTEAMIQKLWWCTLTPTTQRQYNQLPGVQILKLWYRNCGDVPWLRLHKDSTTNCQVYKYWSYDTETVVMYLDSDVATNCQVYKYWSYDTETVVMYLDSDVASVLDVGAALSRLFADDDLRRYRDEVAAQSLWDEWERTRNTQVTLDHLQLVILKQRQR